MRSAFRRIKARITGFKRNEDGMASMEMMLMLPLYLFCIFGTYSYWDAFDVANRAQKATYSLSDLIARQQTSVTEAYVNGMFGTMEYMMGPSLPVETRVTSVFYNGTNNRYEVIWSRSSTPTIPRLTTATIMSLQDHLPIMQDGDPLVVIETEVEFEPIIGLTTWAVEGLESRTMRNVIVTRPRFLPKICMQGVACG